MRPTKRYEHVSDKVKAFIKDKGGNLSEYKKPPRMHNATYKRLSSKQFYYESKSHQALSKELREWYCPKTTAMLDEFFDYVDESKEWRKKQSPSNAQQEEQSA
jgi:hypothetical protein